MRSLTVQIYVYILSGKGQGTVLVIYVISLKGVNFLQSKIRNC